MNEHTAKRRWQRMLGALFVWGLLCLSIVGSSALAEGIRYGLSLCASTVIAAVFPSMILSDLLLSRPKSGETMPERAFARLFHLPSCACLAFVAGLLTGFPIGMRICASLYRQGELTKEEAQRLMAFSNNTGPAFLVAGIGMGLYGDGRIGWLLYACQVLSAIVLGLWLGRGKAAARSAQGLTPHPFHFVESVKSAAERTVQLCAFVCLFSALAYLLTQYLPSTALCLLLLPLLEVSSAASFLGDMSLPLQLSLPLTAFAVGFAGISVHAQASVFLADTDLSLRPYVSAKLTQGCLCFLFCLALSIVL